MDFESAPSSPCGLIVPSYMSLERRGSGAQPILRGRKRGSAVFVCGGFTRCRKDLADLL